MAELLDTTPCESCGTETADPHGCDHGNDLCRACQFEGCGLCLEEACAEREAENAFDYEREEGR